MDHTSRPLNDCILTIDPGSPRGPKDISKMALEHTPDPQQPVYEGSFFIFGNFDWIRGHLDFPLEVICSMVIRLAEISLICKWM